MEKSLVSLIATLAVVSADGSVDVPATLALMEEALNEYVESRSSSAERYRTALDEVLSSPQIKGKRVDKNSVVSHTLTKLGVSFENWASEKEALESFIKQHSSDTREEATAEKPYTVARGKGGGVSRWDLLPEPKAK